MNATAFEPRKTDSPELDSNRPPTSKFVPTKAASHITHTFKLINLIYISFNIGEKKYYTSKYNANHLKHFDL